MKRVQNSASSIQRRLARASIAGRIHFESMAANQDKIVRAMVDHGPFERHAWGVHATPELDRLGVPDLWTHIDMVDAVFRVERQCTLGFPEHRAALFTIHTMITPFRDLKMGQRLQLARAVEGMDRASRDYKGLDIYAAGRMVSWLRES